MFKMLLSSILWPFGTSRSEDDAELSTKSMASKIQKLDNEKIEIGNEIASHLLGVEISKLLYSNDSVDIMLTYPPSNRYGTIRVCSSKIITKTCTGEILGTSGKELMTLLGLPYKSSCSKVFDVSNSFKTCYILNCAFEARGVSGKLKATNWEPNLYGNIHMSIVMSPLKIATNSNEDILIIQLSSECAKLMWNVELTQ
jgi:hypothetical protein